MYYFTIKDENIINAGEVKSLNFQCIEVSKEQYNLATLKGNNYFLYRNGELILNPNYEDEQTAKREADFKTQFFEVKNYGWYRRIPKGYGSAVESMNVLFNIASVSQGIQAGLIIFYETPDFSDPEQCTEEWLVEHQIVMPAMTLQEFMQLYVAFMTAWNTQEHIEGIE